MVIGFIGRVSAEESLFFRPGRRRRQSGQPDVDFIPLFFDELTNVTDAQKMVCEDNQQCLFDLAVTGDMAFALNTLNHQKDANATKEVLGLSVSLGSSKLEHKYICSLALSPGSSQFFNVVCVTLNNWEEPGDEAKYSYHKLSMFVQELASSSICSWLVISKIKDFISQRRYAATVIHVSLTL